MLVLLLFCCIYSGPSAEVQAKHQFSLGFVFISSFAINVFLYFYGVSDAVEAGVHFGQSFLVYFTLQEVHTLLSLDILKTINCTPLECVNNALLST